MAGASTWQQPIAEKLAGGECLTTAALSQLTGLPQKSVNVACCRLVLRGWIVRRERGCYELTDEGRRALDAGEQLTSGKPGERDRDIPNRPTRQTDRDRMWTTMRVLKKFQIAELETMAGAKYDNARRYVWRLERAGYLARLRPEPGSAPTSNGLQRWLLIRNTGPATPIYRYKSGTIYDPNTGDIFGRAA